ncbi:hypothetical protein GQ53DRAFT_873990 [Thozetella sp. PMI_491]|nr:hypothetical protein GQ53DRAFT_873990 [Thozetella sp. PMI_491]
MASSASAAPSACLNDDTLGPGVIGCRDDFDFTITFEDSFLSLTPSAIFAVLAVLRLVYLGRKPQLLHGRGFQLLKLVSIAVYTGLQVATLALVGSPASQRARISIAAAVFSLFDSFLFLALSAWEHSRSQRSSILFNTYLLASLLFDATRARTFWLDDPDGVFVKILTTSIAVKAVVLVLESQGKDKWLSPQERSPEETGGVFTLSFFSWLNGLIFRGYRKILAQNDLHALDPDLSAYAHGGVFKQQWQTVRPGKHRLVRALARTLKWHLFLPVLPRIAKGALSFARPFLVSEILAYLQAESSSISANVGYGLIGATALVYTGFAVSNGIYQYLLHRALTVVRASLVTLIYDTTLSDSTSHHHDNSAAITLMTSDVNRIQIGLEAVHECWASAIEIAIAAWLLQRQLGAAFIAPIVVVLVCGAASFGVGKVIGTRITRWLAAIQRRVGLTADIISNITTVKMLGMQESVTDQVQRSRASEINGSKQVRIMVTLAGILGYAPLLLTPAVTFASTNQDLTFTRAFTSLAYLQLLSSPLAELFQMIPQLMGSIACLERVQKYIEINSKARVPGQSQTTQARRLYGPNDTTFQLAKDAVFSWEEESPVLHSVNVRIPRNKLTIVAGPVASGKSTLCMGILREIPLVTGDTLELDQFCQVAFCAQTAFLINSTVRNNITGHTTFDREWYDKVVEATALNVDMGSWPQGDQSLIGSNGIMLSGGQRHRVSLTRALYARPQFAVFDDVLSGLDPTTEEHVFDHVFAQGGLLDNLRATAILCTHSIGHLKKAAYVVVLGNGSVLTQGPPEAVVTNDYVISTIAKKPAEEEPNSEDSQPKNMASQPPTSKKTQETEDRARQTGDFRIYSYYFARIGSPRTVAAVTSFFFTSAIAFAFLFNFGPVWLEFWSDSVQRGEDNAAFYIGVFITLQVICLCLCGVFFGFNGLVMTPRCSLTIHRLAMVSLMRAPLSYFTSVDVGTITSYFSQDMSIVDNDFGGQLANTVATGLAVLSQGTMIAASSPFVLIGYPGLVGLMWIVQRVYLRTSRQLRLLELETNGPLQEHFLETLTGLATIRAFGWTSQNIRANYDLLDASQRPRYLLTMLQRWLEIVLSLTVTVLAVVFVTLAIQIRTTRVGFTGVGLVSLMSFGEMLGHIVRCYTQLETATGALNRLKTFIETMPKSTSNLGPGAALEQEYIPSAVWPERGQVEIRGVSAVYSAMTTKNISSGREQTTANEDTAFALRDISLSIESSEKIAIYGRTGRQSSLVMLMLKFLDPINRSGTITIDGLELGKIRPSVLRSRIITLPQAPFLLPEGKSVRDNMIINDLNRHKTYNTSLLDEEAKHALSAVGLWSLVEEKGGLDSGLNPGNLSKGQRQLFCLARAILRSRLRLQDHNTPRAVPQDDTSSTVPGGLLLLDEFTASVDYETDKLMQAIIRREFKNYTIICVTHRLQTVIDYDRLVVMDGGRIVDIGRPSELIRDDEVMGQEGAGAS